MSVWGFGGCDVSMLMYPTPALPPPSRPSPLTLWPPPPPPPLAGGTDFRGESHGVLQLHGRPSSGRDRGEGGVPSNPPAKPASGVRRGTYARYVLVILSCMSCFFSPGRFVCADGAIYVYACGCAGMIRNGGWALRRLSKPNCSRAMRVGWRQRFSVYRLLFTCSERCAWFE